MEELQKQEQDRKYWHSGYVGGYELAFHRYKGILHYETEHNLAKEPLKIDFLIIKKEDNHIIDNAIGVLFKKHNIIEIKSPDDELNEDVVWKTIGYAGIYKSLAKTVGEIPSSEITITISRSRKPVKLFKNLMDKGKEIENPYSGIYYLKGLVEIPIQVVVTKELEGKDFNALKILRKKADPVDVTRFIDEVKRYTDQGDIENANAVFHLFKQANRELYYEMRGENNMKYETLSDFFGLDFSEVDTIFKAKDLLKKRAEERDSGIEVFIKDQIEDEIPVDRIVAKLQKYYNLTEDKAKEYVQKYTPVANDK